MSKYIKFHCHCKIPELHKIAQYFKIYHMDVHQFMYTIPIAIKHIIFLFNINPSKKL